MPKKLSPEEATVMIIRRRLQQMEEAKIAERESEGNRTAANDDDMDLSSAGASSAGLSSAGSPATDSLNTADESPKE